MLRLGAARCPSSAGRGCTSAASPPTTPPTSATPPPSSGPTWPRGCCATWASTSRCAATSPTSTTCSTRPPRARGSRSDSFAAVQQFRFDRDMAALGVRRPAHEPRAHNYVAQVVTLAAALLEAGAPTSAAARSGSAARGVTARAGLDRGRRRAALAVEFGEASTTRAERTGRRRRLAGGARARRGGVAEPVGRGPARLARRVRGDGADHLRARPRPARRRRGPALPAPRLRGRDGRGGHRGRAVRAGVDARRHRAGWTASKMAKSTGNLVLVSDVVAKHPAAVLRLLLIDRPWARPWDFEPGRAGRRRGPAGAALRRGGPRARHGAPRRRRAVTAALLGRPGRAGRPGRGRGGRRRGGPAGAVGARPELTGRPTRSSRVAARTPTA